MRLFFHKIFHFEYWPWKWFYAPLYPYYLYLGIRNRDLVFPANVNTCLPFGGLFHEDKARMLQDIDSQYLPQSQVFLNNARDTLSVPFPIVAKPMHAQRGTNVAICNNIKEFDTYQNLELGDIIVQEYISYDIELAVLYMRQPGHTQGIVSSITHKEFLTVIGDGESTVYDLLQANIRALMVGESLFNNIKVDIKQVLAIGQKLVVEPVGNHCRGTLFRHASELDDKKIALVCDNILVDFDGFHYGRFDMRVKSIEDLYEGKNIRILELNGVNADAAHVFDPNMTLIRSYKDIAWHWKALADIALINNKLKPKISLWSFFVNIISKKEF